jgi:4-amino-4-deoxy-L-arabinose transferase-like glycosyltransferase
MRHAKLIPLCAALSVFIAHLAANPHYGFFRDELYFIVCGFHPAWGYVDQPPLVPLLAAGSQLFGRSLFLARAVAALFAGCSTYVTCLIVIELGGGIFAQIFAALVAFFSPVLMNFGMKISTDSPGLLLWPLAALCVLRVVKGRDPRWWLVAGAALGLAFQAKYSVVFFAAALVVGLLATPERRVLRSWWFVASVALALAIALHNVLWQLRFNLPMLELLKNGQQGGKNVNLNPAEFIFAEFLITNPVLALVWVSGLVWLLRNRSARFFGFTFVALMLEMIALHAKHYYPANVYPILIGAGGVAIEQWTQRARVLRPAIGALATVSGLILAPYALPILPIQTFIPYHQTIAPLLHLETARTERGRVGALPQDWADMQGWPELTRTVAQVYATLSPEEQARAVIFAQNYGEAAALEFFGTDYGLPPVVSGHNQYYLWGTRGRSGDILIDIKGDCGKEYHLYRSATYAATFTHPYMRPFESRLPILICRGINQSFEEFWPRVKFYY